MDFVFEMMDFVLEMMNFGRFEKGGVVIRGGDVTDSDVTDSAVTGSDVTGSDNCMYFVCSGVADAAVHGDLGKPRVLSPGDHFGELALAPLATEKSYGEVWTARSATVTARENCVLLSLTRTSYLKVLSDV